MKVRTALVSTLMATGLLSASSLLLAAPAQAAEASGTQSCPGTKEVRLRVDAGAGGNGTWIDRPTGASQRFMFPSGASFKFAPYKSVRWSVTTPTFFYSAPFSTCI